MRLVRYAVAMSLDGYIAGPNGEADWIPRNPGVDFAAVFAQFDTLLVGRRTFERMVDAGRARTPGMRTIVSSRTLRPEDYPDFTIGAHGANETVTALKAAPGKDIWLFGGGSLFGSLVEAGLVDTVEVSVVPILLGGGVPLRPFSGGRRQIKLSLTGHKVYPVGIVSLAYAVV